MRHRGTLGGALVHADPAGDLPAPILALDAELVIEGAGGERTVAAADFFEDLFTTAVGEDEILTEIRIPKHTGWGGALREVHPGRPAVVDRRRSRPRCKADGGTISEAQDRADQHGLDGDPRVARSRRRSSGSARRRTRSAAACASAADGTNPPTDTNGDADYRRHLAAVLTGGPCSPPPGDLTLNLEGP